MSEDTLALFDKTFKALEALHQRASEGENPGLKAIAESLKAEIARVMLLHAMIQTEEEQEQRASKIRSLLEKRNGMYFFRKRIESFGADVPFCARCLSENGMLMALTGPEVVHYEGSIQENCWKCPVCKDQYRVRWVP